MPTPSNSGLSAKAHSSVRQKHLNERTEDYVEAIWRLEQQQEESVRVVDLQEIFGVSHVTVIRAIKKLEGEGYILRTRKSFKLSAQGTRLAKKCFDRHTLIERFLISLGISEKTAAHDAEGIEHHLSTESLQAFKNHLDSR